MNDRGIIIPLLRMVIPGDHDPALDFYGANGPKGGKKIVCPANAFNPKDGYLTRLIRDKHVGVRHGYRGFWETLDSADEEKARVKFSLFSITLPDDPVVRTICGRPWKAGMTSSPAWKSAQSGNLQPMLDEIKALTLRKTIVKANGGT